MKKLSILLIMLSFVTYLAFSRNIIITQDGGGPNGFNFVNESHTDGKQSSDTESELFSSGKGFDESKWKLDISTMSDMIGPSGKSCPWEDLKDYVLNKIKNDCLTGNFVDNIEQLDDLWFRSVSWEAKDSTHFKIIIKINLAKE